MKPAFTLIELLVVVTIIVVLLALLTPALDKAIYTAELTVCGAHQKGIATGATTYAAGSKRYYPHRSILEAGGRANMIVGGNGGGDDRPYLTPTIGLKILLDPFAGGIDLSTTRVESNVYSNYALWFGMKYLSTTSGGQGLKKIGDRLVWNKTRFNVLVSCEDFTFTGGGLVDGHPDDEGVTQFYAYQDEGADDWGVTDQEAVDGYFTLSRWTHTTATERGRMDLNYAFQDGSVQLFKGVIRDEELDNPEQRMAKLPYQAGDANTVDWWTQLPPAR